MKAVSENIRLFEKNWVQVKEYFVSLADKVDENVGDVQKRSESQGGLRRNSTINYPLFQPH